MKQTKLFLFTCLLTISAFTVVMYSASCKKDKCKGVSCQNGGTCSGGNCSCPSRYSGTRCEKSSIVFQNNAPTDLNITVNGSATTIAADGGTITYIGAAGSSISVSAISTAGAVGEIITWPSFTDYFPTDGDNLTEPFDVASSYFYLLIKNNSGENINKLYVNYGKSPQTLDYPIIPNDGVTYGVGYYQAYSNTYVYALNTNTGDSWDWPSPYTGSGAGIYIINSTNASATLIAN